MRSENPLRKGRISKRAARVTKSGIEKPPRSYIAFPLANPVINPKHTAKFIVALVTERLSGFRRNKIFKTTVY